MTLCNEVENEMKKFFAFFIFLFGTSLLAINQKQDESAAQKNIRLRKAFLHKIRSITPTDSPESSEDESEESSSDSSSEEWYIPLEQSLLAKTCLERFGGYLFGGAMIVLISYKFYSAGYL